MFTVVIAEKEHLRSIEKYRFFLEPFYDSDKVAFCEWKLYEEKLIDIVPSLFKTIEGKVAWRLLLIADDKNINMQNPFDRVNIDYPTKIKDEDKAAYERRIHEAKISAFDQVTQNPIARLMTSMCQWPLEDGGINCLEENSEYSQYLEESRKKLEIRKNMISENNIKFVLPSQIICVARRNYQKDKEYMNDVWTPHYEEQYSSFSERNMYFDKMRYLLFDIKDKNHSEHNFDYLRFLYTVLILAQNDIPTAAIKPERVYVIKSSLEREKLKKLLDEYDKKLAVTERKLREMIREIETSPKVYITDEEAEAMIASKIDIPISASQEVSKEEIYIKLKIGLSTDCPEEEKYLWERERKKTIARFRLLIKRTKRLLMKASGHFKELNTLENENSGLMEPYQVEDMKEGIAENELKMASIDMPNIFGENEYEKRLDKEDENVRGIIRTRMNRNITIVLGVAALMVVFAAFIPIIASSFSNILQLVNILLTALATIGILGGICILILLILRMKLKAQIASYNSEVDNTISDIDAMLNQYSKYLGYACNVMRANSIINEYYERNNPEQKLIKIYKKHIADIRSKREEIYDLFGELIDIGRNMDLSSTEPYEYDFDKSMDYRYPVCFDECDKRLITFIQPGNEIYVPTSFIGELAIEREDLYD